MSSTSPVNNVDHELSEWGSSSKRLPPVPRKRPNARLYGLIAASAICLVAFLSLGSWPGQMSLDLNSKNEPACNPFAKPGVLSVNTLDRKGNFWQPFDPRCPKSTLMESLINKEDLPWLENRTVVLLGSSVDRNHIHHFCWALNADLQLIQSDDPRDAPPFKNGYDEFLKPPNVGTPSSDFMNHPWVCHLPQWNFMLYNVFAYGVMEPSDWDEEWFKKEPHYYPPFATPLRVEHLVKPLQKNLNRTSLDILSFSASLWDSMFLQRTQNLTLNLPFETTSFTYDNRLILQYAHRLSKTIRDVAALLPEVPTILFRTGQLPRDNFSKIIPQDVVAQVDDVGQAVVSDLQEPTDWIPWFAEAEHREEAKAEAKALKLRQRLRLDYSGKLLHGQQRFLMPDGLHPDQLPGGKLWADIILWELRRSVLKSNPELVEPSSKM